jgi:hypothetical protein
VKSTWERIAFAPLVAAALAQPGCAIAQVVQGAPVARIDSAVVMPGPMYAGGAFTSLVFGSHYRALWTTRLTVPILRLDTVAGGLRVLKRGGSMQTRALRFAGADGREYVFRSVDKDPTPSLPPELRGTYANRILRDMVSAEHPAAALVVARLLEAAHVPHAAPQLVVLPDDSLLGESRQEFRGLLGLFEVRPTEEGDPGDAVVSSEKLFARLEKNSDEKVDAPMLLAARLMDVFVGDWDRHPDQWRWERFRDAPADGWMPIPRDRDWALVRLDGFVWALVRFAYPYPQFVSFQRDYPDLVWLNWNGRVLDRRLLSSLDKRVWDSVVTVLHSRLTDSVIADAVLQIPPELFAVNGAKLTRTLDYRRDHLREMADRYYRLLAAEAEVHATDDNELVEITRVSDRLTDVSITPRSKSGRPRSRASFERRFDARETREIRLFLHGGNDSVVVRGPSGTPLVRVVGAGGRDIYVDSTSNTRERRVLVYDVNPESRLVGASNNAIDRRSYQAPPTRHGWADPPRDWGSRWRPYPWLGYTPDEGVFIGGGPLFERYSFRHDPYESKMMLRVGYATGAGRWRAEYDADFRRGNSPVHATVFARASELDVVRFFGFGNETTAPNASSFYKVDQKQLALEPMLVVPLATRVKLGIGPTLKYVVTSREAARFITTSQPYGAASFGQVAGRLRLTADTRDTAENARRGVFVSTQATLYPALWDVRSTFAGLRSSASTYVSAPTRFAPTLALRVGGDKLWGTYPFYEAAFVGGASTVRGWREQRFAGDASVYGNAELRFFLTKFFFLLPGDLGAFGLADGGRVFQNGERSDAWHSAFGGGLWAAFLGRTNTLSVSYARGKEGGGFYFRSGLLY